MMNEVMQWMTLILIGLLVLGIFRQVSLMLPPAARAVLGGPRLGARLPRRVLEEIRRAARIELDGEAMIAFVSENCLACQELLASLSKTGPDDDGATVVLVSKSPNERFRQALAETGRRTIYDEGGRIWKAVGVTATPLVVRVDGTGRVNAKEVAPHVDFVVQAR